MTPGVWQTIDTAPKDGRRLRLGNDRDVSSMKIDSMFKVSGVFEDGRWHLNAFFTVPGGRYGALFSGEPTHWLSPSPSQPRTSALGVGA